MSNIRRTMMAAGRRGGGGGLPAGYTAYDWVEANSSTGAPNIDTGLIPNRSTSWAFDGKFARTANLPSNYQPSWLFSRFDTSGYYCNFALGRTGNKSNLLAFNYNARTDSQNYSGRPSATIDMGVWHTFSLQPTTDVSYGGELILDGVTTAYTANAPNNDAVTTLKILPPNATTSEPFSCRFAEFKVYYDGGLVADFVPAKRDADNVVGFYDAVRQSFYAPSAEGVLLLCGNGFDNFS